MVTVIEPNNEWADVFGEFGKGLSKGYQNEIDQRSIQNAVSNLPENATPRQILDAMLNVKTYNPEVKQNSIKNYMGVAEYEDALKQKQEYQKLQQQQFEEATRKAKAQEDIAREKIKVSDKTQSQVEDDVLRKALKADGMPDYQIDQYLRETPGVRQRIIAEHNELKSRGIRQPLSQTTQPAQEAIEKKPVEEIVVEQPIEEVVQEPVRQEIKGIPKVEIEPVKEKEWPTIATPSNITPKEQERWRDKNQTTNTKELKELREKGSSHKKELASYGILKQLNDSKKLPSGLSSLILDPTTGDPYPLAAILGQVNTETQQFTKTLNDFLSGAKNYFGGRVTNFDIQQFKSRLPGLLNTDSGRRVIIEQMKLMTELQSVGENELYNAIKHYGRDASLIDIQRVVDEKVASREEELLRKINKVTQAAEYLDKQVNDPRLKGTVLMETPDGTFRNVREIDVQKAMNRGYKKW